MFDPAFIQEMLGMGVVLVAIIGIAWFSDRGLDGR